MVEWQIRSDMPFQVGDATVTLLAQALTVRWRHAGLVWNRPLALLVERSGQVERVQIIDLTRLIQIGLLVLGLAALLIAYTKRSAVKEKDE